MVRRFKITFLFKISIIITLILTGSNFDQAQQLNSPRPDDTVKLRVNMIDLNVAVLDPYGRAVRGLTKDNFEVYEDKTKQNIDLFSSGDAPVSIGFVFDLSGSMAAKAGRARDALREFINASNPDDEMFLIGFNNKARLLTDFTKRDSEILNSVATMPAAGMTALYDAVYMGIEKVKQGRNKRKVLFVISDGQDNQSRYTDKEIRNLIKESDIEIFSIGTTAIWQYITLDDYEGMVLLDDLGRMSGGTAYFPRDFNEMSRACLQIATQIRNQYSLAYVPTNSTFDGKWRKLRIRIKGMVNGGYVVLRSRDGYYARP